MTLTLEILHGAAGWRSCKPARWAGRLDAHSRPHVAIGVELVHENALLRQANKLGFTGSRQVRPDELERLDRTFRELTLHRCGRLGLGRLRRRLLRRLLLLDVMVVMLLMCAAMGMVVMFALSGRRHA